MRISAETALQNNRANATRRWNKAPDSATRSSDPNDASNRIFDGFADVRPTYSGPKFKKDTPVFAMGSCFAREIEWALRRRGGNIISIDDRIQIPEFAGDKGRASTSFFHRYTPTSMAQEFLWPFGRLPTWHEDALILETKGGFDDMNYAATDGANTLEAVRVRRRVAGDLTRNMTTARIIIVTLGLAEGWIDLPTGLAVNAMNGAALLRNQEQFELSKITFNETMSSLATIRDVIETEHSDGDYHLFITVSPVPFSMTFTSNDVIEANATSKSTLRAAAAAFTDQFDNAHYFPSFELVSYSSPEVAWRPDRIHVQPEMVKHIMDRFIGAVYEPGAL